MEGSNNEFIDFIDLNYIILNSLRNSRLLMNGIVLNINDDGFTLIISGFCLKYIEYSSRENSLKLVSPPISLIDLIDEFYSSRYNVDEVLNGDWLNAKFIKKMIKKYPKAFESYLAEKEAVDELAKKYGLDFKLIVDYEGQMYAQLLWRDVESNMYKIQELISVGIAVFEEKCSMPDVTSLEEAYPNRNLQLIEVILNYLDMIKDVYTRIKDTKLSIKRVEVSNSVDILSLIEPKIELQLCLSSGETLGIIISEAREVKLKLIQYSKRIRKELMDLLKRDSFNLEREDPTVYIKSFTSLKETHKWITNKLLSQIS